MPAATMFIPSKGMEIKQIKKYAAICTNIGMHNLPLRIEPAVTITAAAIIAKKGEIVKQKTTVTNVISSNPNEKLMNRFHSIDKVPSKIRNTETMTIRNL